MPDSIPSRFRRNEKLFPWLKFAGLLLLFIGMGVLKWLYLRAYRIDSDEPQHLHVVWGWTQGMVQYRDFFDNHTPLFQILCAPILAWLGERPDILYPMRMAMVPLYVGSLAALYGLTAALYNRASAIWATLIVGCWSGMMLTATEFRTDDLWVCLWFVTLLAAFRFAPSWRQGLAVGFLLGATICSSMKTTLLLGAFLSAAIPFLGWRLYREGNGFLQGLWKRAGAFSLGLIILPTILLVYFSSQHALEALIYCVFKHNMIEAAHHHLPFVKSIFAGFIGGAVLYALAPSVEKGMARAILFTGASLFLGLLHAYWPLITAQDYLPVTPLLIITLFPFLWEQMERLPWAHVRMATTAALCIGVVSYTVKETVKEAPLNVDHMALFSDGLGKILKLTAKDEFLMDGKGETIFRRRPYYYVLEGVTKRRMRAHLLRDTITADCIRTNTCVIVNHRLPGGAKRWMRANYVQVASDVYVSGVKLDRVPSNTETGFEIQREADYRVFSPQGVVGCMVDGVPTSGVVHLKPGKHTLTYQGEGPLAVVLAKTFDAGLSPFTTQDLVVTLVKDHL